MPLTFVFILWIKFVSRYKKVSECFIADFLALVKKCFSKYLISSTFDFLGNSKNDKIIITTIYTEYVFSMNKKAIKEL